MVTYLDTEGSIITAEEFWRLVEHITLEGDQHHSEQRLARDVTTALATPAADVSACAEDDGYSGWVTGDPALG